MKQHIVMQDNTYPSSTNINRIFHHYVMLLAYRMNRREYLPLLKAVKDLGKAIHNSDTDEAVAALDAVLYVNSYYLPLAQTLARSASTELNEEIGFCTHKMEFTSEDLVETEDGLVCQSVADDLYVYSELQGTYVLMDDAFIYNGNYVSQRYADRNDLYYWESDCEYHDEPEEDDSCRGDDPRQEYHENNWDDEIEELNEKFYCIELEVKANDHDDLRDLCDSSSWYATCDGSLDDDLGVELVVKPLRDAILESEIKCLAKVNGRAQGHDAGSQYGMHINISRRCWNISTLHLGKMLVFIASAKTMLEEIAQRKENNWAKFTPKTITHAHYDSVEKYEALNVRDDRLEFRFFRSNTKIERILKNLEAVKAIVEFTRHSSILSLNIPAFKNWLALQEGQFRHLREFFGMFTPTQPKPGININTSKKKNKKAVCA